MKILFDFLRKSQSDSSQSTRFFIFIIGFVALVLWRMPKIIFLGGRFWAEEGAVYFRNAWTVPWYAAWFAIHTGYLNFVAGFSTWLALMVGGIEHAPLITVIIALIIQCLPVYVVITHEFSWSRSNAATAIAVLFCALPPLSGEVWLNTITSQFHLALCAALIFAAPPKGRRLCGVDALILAVGVLSGPATSFLTPLFVADALRKRTRVNIAFAVILSLGLAIQASIYLTHIMASRGDRLDPEELLSIISLHTIVLPIAGPAVAGQFSRHLASAHKNGHVLWEGSAIFVAVYGYLGVALWRIRAMGLLRLMVAGLVITLVSFYEALFGSFSVLVQVLSGQRYAFVPEVVLALLFLGATITVRGMLRAPIVLGTVVMLCVGGVYYKSGLGLFRDGPAWRRQVTVWQRDPSVPLKMWPAGWRVNLPPHARRVHRIN